MNLPLCPTSIILSPTKHKQCLGNNPTINSVPCVQLTASSIQLRKYSQLRLANDNNATDQTPVMIDTASSNGVAMELFNLFLITQPPSSIDVDENRIEKSSRCLQLQQHGGQRDWCAQDNHHQLQGRVPSYLKYLAPILPQHRNARAAVYTENRSSSIPWSILLAIRTTTLAHLALTLGFLKTSR